MTDTLKIAIAQFANLVGDVEGNAQRILAHVQQAHAASADLIIFPELALTGYPPEDLLLRPGFHQRAQRAFDTMKQQLPKDIYTLCGHSDYVDGKVYNAASWLFQNEIIATYYKQQLPNYSVFDEKRYFAAGQRCCIVSVKGFKIATLICEDIWAMQPLNQLLAETIDGVIVINASPFHHNKHQQRVQLLQDQIKKINKTLVYVHCVGGQDDLVFDGGSMVFNAEGACCARAPFFEEALLEVRLEKQYCGMMVRAGPMSPVPGELAMTYGALVRGIKDYIHRNGFSGAIVGVSGGIDSALTLALAVDAIGAGNVLAVSMPSRYSATMSSEDAKIQADRHGVMYQSISIESCYQSFIDSLGDVFKGLPHDVTEQNIQARCRGVLLMALSNKTGKLVLTTGNKSEVAVGYATLYGDMVGGFAALKDVLKTQVYQLAKWRNREQEIIPSRVILRAPSAELAPDQLDTDSLPPYDILDDILVRYIEQEQGVDAIVAAGHDRQQVLDVMLRVDNSEYKRRQSAPGTRVSERAFGRDRRYPITSGYSTSRQ